MGLWRCTECKTIEGDWEQVEDAEVKGEYSWRCCECGNCDCVQDIPEHDDGDMER